MPNALAKDLELAWDEFGLAYDGECVVSKECKKISTDQQTMQRAGDTFYQPQEYMASVVTGLDISGAANTDVIQRFVPTVFRSPDNVKFILDAKEMRDPATMREMGKAAAKKLGAEVDKNIYKVIGDQASIVVKKVGALNWKDGATAEALLVSRGSSGKRKLFLNPFDHLEIAQDLGNKAYMTDWSKDAYERSRVPNIATFETFRTDNQYILAAAGTVSGITINGTQSFTPSSMANEQPVDNRKMTLVVAGANVANTKIGDSFTIPGVNAVHMMDKSDTGKPMTVRILGGAGTVNLVVTPALVATGPYQNVTAAAANGVTLAFQNTVAAPVNPFWTDGAVTIAYGKLAFPSGQGVDVKMGTTAQGVPLIMSWGFNHLTAVTTVRFTTLYATTVLNPDHCGIIIANQT